MSSNNHCGTRFSQSKLLTDHIASAHGKIKDYLSPRDPKEMCKCAICNGIFKNTNDLMEHFKNVHEKG